MSAAIGDQRAALPAGGAGELIAVKLWENPCWFSYRINFLALQFNVPVYRWIESTLGVQRAEFMILFSLSLRDGVTASAVCASSGFPRNTVSRAVQKLMDRGAIEREVAEGDLRSFELRITAHGRAIVEVAMQPMLEREKAMLSSLTPGETLMLSELLAKLVIESSQYPDAWPGIAPTSQEAAGDPRDVTETNGDDPAEGS